MCWGLCWALVLSCACRCSYKFNNYLAEEKGAGCFTLFVLWLCFCRFLAVPWVGMQSVIVVFLGNTHLLFGYIIVCVRK